MMIGRGASQFSLSACERTDESTLKEQGPDIAHVIQKLSDKNWCPSEGAHKLINGYYRLSIYTISVHRFMHLAREQLEYLCRN